MLFGEEAMRDTLLAVFGENKSGDVAMVLIIGDSVWARIVSAAWM